jgi:hypothetical protein
MSDQESNETPAETQAPAVAAVAEPGEVATAPVGGTERALRKSRVGVVVCRTLSSRRSSRALQSFMLMMKRVRRSWETRCVLLKVGR